MRITVELGEKRYQLGQKYILSPPIHFDGRPLGFHDANAPQKKQLAKVEKDPINWEELHLIPHSHGTHTESVAHITKEPYPVHRILSELLLPCTLFKLELTEKELSREVLDCLSEVDPLFMKALVLSCKGREKDAFLTVNAMRYLHRLGVEHLAVDQLSVDPLKDEGRLLAHRAHWGLMPGENDLGRAQYPYKTITELVRVPDSIKPGQYFLNLQMPALDTDAVPSRLILYDAQEIS